MGMEQKLQAMLQPSDILIYVDPGAVKGWRRWRSL